MKTAMQELLDDIQKHIKVDWPMNIVIRTAINNALEKEKEQIQKAFSDGQETPINHPTLPHYSREEYYNDNYNQDK